MYLFIPILYWKLTGAGMPLVPSVIVVAPDRRRLLGAINGFMTAYVGIPSFVATLGMLFASTGLTLIISHSEQITTPGTEIVGVTTFAQIFGAGTYSEMIWVLGIVVDPAGAAELHALGAVHGVGRRQPVARGRGGDQHAAGDDPQLRPVRDDRGIRGNPRGGAHLVASAPIRRAPTRFLL